MVNLIRRIVVRVIGFSSKDKIIIFPLFSTCYPKNLASY